MEKNGWFDSRKGAAKISHSLMLLLITTLGLVWLAEYDKRETDVVMPSSPQRPAGGADLVATDTQSNATASTASSPVEVEGGGVSPSRGADPFHPVSFVPPPPPLSPPPPSAVAVKPTAPSFPFRYFGRVAGVDGDTFYLVRDDVLISVVPAQVIDNAYRIDAVGPSEIRVTYLPLQETTILSLPGS